MAEQPSVLEQVAPHARIQSELVKLDSQKRELWIAIAFSAAVLLLGILSLLIPTSFWHMNALELKFSPQILFVAMMAMLAGVLYMMRQDLEMRRLRLINIQQMLVARTEQAASMIDSVTNVFTRAFLHDLLQGEISRAERNNRPLALLMCDLNNFKLVNDRYGHLMGDYVLAQVATILKSCVRGSDFIVRYGGDEFLLVLPETDQKGAEVVLQRIQTKLEEWDHTNRVGDLPVSLSIGLYLHVNGQTPEQDVAEADARMYAFKGSTKRNGVTAAGA